MQICTVCAFISVIELPRIPAYYPKTDEAEKKLNQQEMSVEARNTVDHFIDLSMEIDDESHAVLYLATFIDSYRFFKALGLVVC